LYIVTSLTPVGTCFLTIELMEERLHTRDVSMLTVVEGKGLEAVESMLTGGNKGSIYKHISGKYVCESD